jgi:hypothetical protein
MEGLVNWALLREPINWIIVALMLMIGTFGLHLISKAGGNFPNIGGNPASPRANAPGV